MELVSSNYDLIFLGIIIASTIFALIRGGIAEILSISSWFIALWFMHKYGELINHFIPQNITNPLLRSIIVYIIIFIIVAVVIALIKKFFASIISKLGLGGLNYLIGFIFGIIRGVFICAIIVVIIEMLNLDISHNWDKAKTYPIIRPAMELIVNAIPDSIKKLPAPPKINFSRVH
ncbi:MAG: CvpA family protein [Neisseriaceae bacterium]|jgi:membrane protein required for colicin V production